MAQILTRCFLVYCSIVLIGLAACQKDKTTVVNGTVVDKVTGQPIQGALVEFIVNYKDDPTRSGLHDTYTDESGNFSFDFSTDYSLNVYYVVKSGYLPKGLGTHVVDVEQGKVNDVIIEMIPKDGVLKLNFENSTGIQDTIY